MRGVVAGKYPMPNVGGTVIRERDADNTLRAANHCELQFKGVRQVALCRPVDVPARDDTQAQYAPGSASVHLNVLVLDGFTSPIP